MKFGKFTLRDYQEDAHRAITERLKTSESTLLSIPTGMGKAVVLAAQAHAWDGRPDGSGRRVLIYTHRDELIRQLANCVRDTSSDGEMPGIEKGAERVGRSFWEPKIIVSSVQTLDQPHRLRRFDPDKFGLILHDESHRIVTPSGMRVRNYFNRAKLVGATATTDRQDEISLGQAFENVAYHIDIRDAMQLGWICPIMQKVIYLDELDWSVLRRTKHDLSQRSVKRLMEQEGGIHGVADPTIRECGDRPTIVFAASIAHGEAIAEVLNRHKPGKAAAVSGKMDIEQIRENIAKFRAGEIQFLCNCNLLTEGFDYPKISAVVIAKPTRSRMAYAQMAGRGTRGGPLCPVEGKEDLLLMDFYGTTANLSLCSGVDLLGGRYDRLAVEHARGEINRNGDGEPLEELERAQNMLEELRRKERAGIIASASYRVKNVDPFAMLNLDRPILPGWEDCEVPTENQLEALKKQRINCTDRKGAPTVTKKQAKKLLDEMSARREENLCTYSQMSALMKYGYAVIGLSFDDASALLDEIGNNDWKPIDGKRAGQAKHRRKKQRDAEDLKKKRDAFCQLRDLAPNRGWWEQMVRSLLPENPTPDDWLDAAKATSDLPGPSTPEVETTGKRSINLEPPEPKSKQMTFLDDEPG